MSTATLTAVTGAAALFTGVCLLLAGWHRRELSTPAARAMAVAMGVWFLRYGARQVDGADGHVSTIGRALSDPRTLAAMTVVLAISALLYVAERQP